MKSIFIIIACLSALFANAQVRKTSYVEVLYFHGNQRCITCKAIEKHTKDVVFKDLSDMVKKGLVRFREVNFSTSEGEKLAEKYRVSWSSLYVNLWRNGKENRNNLTRFGFENARNNTSFFKVGLKRKITQLLKSR